MGQLIVDAVNKLLSHSFDKCHKLILDKITSAYRRHITQESESDRNETEVFLLQISVSPSNAIFEATLRTKDNKTSVVGDVSRLNRYGNQSICIKDATLERYCFCK